MTTNKSMLIPGLLHPKKPGCLPRGCRVKCFLRADYQEVAQANINVWLHNYEHPVYRQLYSPFLPYASVIDLLLMKMTDLWR